MGVAVAHSGSTIVDAGSRVIMRARVNCVDADTVEGSVEPTFVRRGRRTRKPVEPGRRGPGRRPVLLLCAVLALAVAWPPPRAGAHADGVSITLPLPDVRANLARGFEFYVSMGGGLPHRVLVDTGSTGVVVPRGALGPRAVELGRRGRVEYTSSGKVFEGTYVRAPLTLNVGSSGDEQPRVETLPVEVLAIDRQTCAPGYPRCTIDADLSRVGMLGVGFDRDTGSPAQNPFLQLADVRAGRMAPGYIIAADHITLGITAGDTAGFRYIDLRRSAVRVDDWSAAPGCYGFPEVAGFGYACGTILVDTGISGMILRMPPSRRPPALSPGGPGGQRAWLPSGTVVSVVAPSPEGPVLQYRFAYAPSPHPVPPIAPTSIRWSSLGDTIFVNTGRDVLAVYDYLYDAGRGRIGFRRR